MGVLRAMNIRFRRCLRDESGVAMIEGAFAFLFLVIVFFGMIELTNFIRAKDKMNKVADQFGKVVSSLPRWNELQIPPLLPAAEVMAKPFGVHLSFRLCQGAPRNFDKGYSVTYGAADCAYGEASSAGAPEEAACADAQLNNQNMLVENPQQQFVVVYAGCRYRSTLNFFNLFGDRVVVGRSVNPMRYPMTW